MTATLQRIDRAEGTDRLAAALDADGAAIVSGALSQAQVATLNDDFDRALVGI